jgi:hypothetical protein
MITETQTKKLRPALTSDRWHVVRGRLSSAATVKPHFSRSIVSEHDNRDSAVEAARVLELTLQEEMANRAVIDRDQVLVRAPRYKSVKVVYRYAKES